MRKYDELYMAIKNDRKKSTTPTYLMTRVRNAHTSALMYLTTTLMRRMITTPVILLLNLSTVK